MENLSVEDGFFLPVLFGIVGIFFYAWSAFTEANRFDAEEVACGSGVFADTFEAESVCSGIGPEIQKVILSAEGFGVVKIDYVAQLDTVEVSLVFAEIVGASHNEQKPTWFFFVNLEGDFDPSVLFGGRIIENMAVGVERQGLHPNISLAVILCIGEIPGGNDNVEVR